MRHLTTFVLASLLSWPALALAQEPAGEGEWIAHENDKDKLFEELEELENGEDVEDGDTEVWVFEEDEEGSRWLDPETFGPGGYELQGEEEQSEIFAPEETVPFYEELAPHGRWAWTDDWGWVWLPPARPEGWRPYSRGHWVETDAGWAFAGDESWGPVVYHYGRWTWIASVGWVWVPGRTWAPAWVEWRVADGYIGWAPLPPRPSVGAAVAIGVVAWSFVAYEHFLAPRVYTYSLPRPRVRSVYHRARRLHRMARHGRRRHLAGPRGSWVHRVAGKRPARRQARAMRRASPRPKARRAARREGAPDRREARTLPRPNREQRRRRGTEREQRGGTERAQRGRTEREQRGGTERGRRGGTERAQRGGTERGNRKARNADFGAAKLAGRRDLRTPRPKVGRARPETRRTKSTARFGGGEKKGRSVSKKRAGAGKDSKLGKSRARTVQPRARNKKPAASPAKSKRGSRRSATLAPAASKRFKKSAPTTRRARAQDFSRFRAKSPSRSVRTKPQVNRPKQKVRRSTPRSNTRGSAQRRRAGARRR